MEGGGGVQVKEEEGDRKRRRNRWGDPATAVVKPEVAGKHLPGMAQLSSDHFLALQFFLRVRHDGHPCPTLLGPCTPSSL